MPLKPLFSARLPRSVGLLWRAATVQVKRRMVFSSLSCFFTVLNQRKGGATVVHVSFYYDPLNSLTNRKHVTELHYTTEAIDINVIRMYPANTELDEL